MDDLRAALNLLDEKRNNPHPGSLDYAERWAGWVEGFDAARGILRAALAVVPTERAEPDLVDDLRATFDQGHFMPWEEVIAYIRREAAQPVPEPLTRETLARAIFEAARPDKHWPSWEDYLASFAHGPTQADVWLRKADRVLAALAKSKEDER